MYGAAPIGAAFVFLAMPDKRKHRGQHPADAHLFDASQLPALQQGVRDLSWLLTHGYTEGAAIKLVGDRYRLQSRQRQAVCRCACSRQSAALRRARLLPPEALRGQTLCIDGFNLLITIESALSGGILLEGVDGCWRDLASIHGSYRRVIETEPAILLAGQALQMLGIAQAVWYLDRPVSNSGRLKQALLEAAAAQGWPWEVELLYNPDQALKDSPAPAASADSVVLDHAAAWFNLARYIIERSVPQAEILPLGALVALGE